jgi:hypothetical protein
MHNSLKIIKTLLYSYSALHVSGTLMPIYSLLTSLMHGAMNLKRTSKVYFLKYVAVCAHDGCLVSDRSDVGCCSIKRETSTQHKNT